MFSAETILGKKMNIELGRLQEVKSFKSILFRIFFLSLQQKYIFIEKNLKRQLLICPYHEVRIVCLLNLAFPFPLLAIFYV